MDAPRSELAGADQDGALKSRGTARRAAFLAAARTVFLNEGYEAASVNDVVRLAGGSLATLYSQFGNKEGLFLAVAQDMHERFAAAMRPSAVDHLPLKDGLRCIGVSFMRAVLERDNLAFYRILVGEGRKFPQLLRRYLSSSGADMVRAAVSTYLQSQARDFEGHDRAAWYFLDMLRSRYQYMALADDGQTFSEDEIAAHVDAVVEFMMRGLGAPAQH